MNKITKYKTSDFLFASVLYALGMEFDGIKSNPQDYKRKWFLFIDNGEIEEIKKKFLNRKLKIEPQIFWNAMEKLKTLIRQEI